MVSLLGLDATASTAAVPGRGQTWQNPARSQGVWYQNDTGRSIIVSVSVAPNTASGSTDWQGDGSYMNFYVSPTNSGGILVGRAGHMPEIYNISRTRGVRYEVASITNIVIPPTWWYLVNTLRLPIIQTWAELR